MWPPNLFGWPLFFSTSQTSLAGTLTYQPPTFPIPPQLLHIPPQRRVPRVLQFRVFVQNALGEGAGILEYLPVSAEAGEAEEWQN